MWHLVSVVSLTLACVALRAEVRTEPASYTFAGKTYSGRFVFEGSRKGKRPGVLIAPEWWGITRHELDAAHRLASRGYVVLVMDLYGEGKKTEDPLQAKELMRVAQKNDGELNQLFDRALSKLKSHPSVDDHRLGALGFGFGGGMVLEQVRLGKDLRAVTSFYGGLRMSESAVKPIKAEILVLVGDSDFYVSRDQIEEFKSELKSLKAKNQVIVFPGVYHDFANKLADRIGTKENLPYSYDEGATKKAWALTDELFDRTLLNLKKQ
jgi:dienelactone hydrolase